MNTPVKLVAAALFLTGCAHNPEIPESVVRTVTVEVPVYTSCVPDNLNDRPEYPDTAEVLRTAADAASRYLLIFRGREARNDRLEQLETVIENCRTK